MGLYLWEGKERELFQLNSRGPRSLGNAGRIDTGILLAYAMEPIPGIDPLDPGYYGLGDWGQGAYYVRYDHAKYPYAEFHHVQTYDGFMYAERAGLLELVRGMGKCWLRAVPQPVGMADFRRLDG